MDRLISLQAAIDAPVKMVSEGLDWIPVYHIKGLPSAQPDNRLSKIADLVEGTIDHFDLDDAMNLLYQIKDVLDGSDELPSAQPDIIRCKDCMHYGTYYRGNESKPVITHLCKWCLDRTMEPDDYCSHAERRTDDL